MPLNSQLGVKVEGTYGTAVTVDRFYEFNSESIEADLRRISSAGLRSTGRVARTDRFVPYIGGAAGALELEVHSKGFGWWLRQMLGGLATGSQGGDGEYAHTGTIATLTGDSFTCQVNRPFHPSGTSQPVTYEGGKVTSWKLSNSVDGLLIAEIDCDFEDEATATALASASYPSDSELMSFVGGSVTVDSTAYPVVSAEVSMDNRLNVDRRKLRGSSRKQEPTEMGDREITWQLEADFASLDEYAYAVAEAAADTYVEIELTWEAPTVIGGTTNPSLVVTIPAARFDSPMPTASGQEELMQTLTGIGLYDGSNEPITIVYTSADATA